MLVRCIVSEHERFKRPLAEGESSSPGPRARGSGPGHLSLRRLGAAGPRFSAAPDPAASRPPRWLRPPSSSAFSLTPGGPSMPGLCPGLTSPFALAKRSKTRPRLTVSLLPFTPWELLPAGGGGGGASCRPLPPAAGEKRARALMLSCPFHLTGAPVFPWSPCFSKAREVGCWRCSHPSFAFSFSFPCCGGFWFPPEGSGRISPHCDISSSL